MDMLAKWQHWKYKNTSLLIASLALFFYFAQSDAVQTVIKSVGSLGYVGAFVAGMFFVSTFTAAPAAVVMFKLAEYLNPLEVALFAGLGAMLGDYIIFRALKDNVFAELQPIFTRMGGKYLVDLFKTPYFAWLLPLVGAIIIASPLPDEAGISILGLSRLSRRQFLLISFLLNATGIFFVVLLAKSI